MFCFVFKKEKSRFPGPILDTESQISRGTAQKPTSPRESAGKCEDQEGCPISLAGGRRGWGQDLISSFHCPKLQVEHISVGPAFAPSACPDYSLSSFPITASHTCTCQALPLANARHLPMEFSLLGTRAPCPISMCPNPLDQCGRSVPLSSSAGQMVGSVGRLHLETLASTSLRVGQENLRG